MENDPRWPPHIMEFSIIFFEPFPYEFIIFFYCVNIFDASGHEQSISQSVSNIRQFWQEQLSPWRHCVSLSADIEYR